MAYGDPKFSLLASGSMATSAAAAHNIFGNYGGLSNQNANEVISLIVSASGGDLRISLDPTTVATNDTALRLFSGGSLFDIPPMTITNASQITVARETGTNNPVVYWSAVVRTP